MSRAAATDRLVALPTWYGPATIGVAIFAGLTLVGRPAGLGLSVALAGLLAAGAAAAPVQDRWTRTWWVLATGLAAMPALRTAGWVVALCVLGSLALAAVASARVATWGRLWIVPVLWLAAVVPGPLVVAGLAGRTRSSAVLRGAVLAALLVALFGSLFAAADAAFADLTGRVLPEVGDDLYERVALMVLVAGVAGAVAIVTGLREAAAAPAPASRLGRTESVMALGALVALFAAFVAVQAAALFGGDAFVQRTAGLTYAEYARSGFALLLVLAGLVLAVLAAAARWGRADRRLLGALCVLTLVVLASAWHRLDLYVDAYGATRARAFAGWSIGWLAGLFGLVLALRGGQRLPRAVITWSAVLGLAFGLSNPDRRIAARATDPAYRQTLSDDAAPVLGRCVRSEGGLWSYSLGRRTQGCRGQIAR